MAQPIINRGPDDEGFHLEDNVGLGFRRLSIIDLDTGHQPLANEDDRIWIVFNGEIYNYQELRQHLLAKGHRFKTQTDTETIVHLYEEYGAQCVKHLRGMFAFAIWDGREKKLFCARDRFGIKPFFYYLDEQKFVFASEIKSVLAGGKIDRELSLEGLDHYLAFGYSAADGTIFKHIKKLEPGYTVEIQAGKKPVFRKYWEIRYEPDFSKSEREWCELIEQKLSESVKMHLMSDVPLGAFLSGGIDSSAVVGLMAKHSDQPVKTFSIGFKEAGFNELPYAREVAKMYNTEHHERIVEPESVSLLSQLVNTYNEPFADASAIPTYYVSRFAREFVTVTLSGDGGDELFAGYTKYPKIRNIHAYNFMPDQFNRHFWGTIHRVLPGGAAGKGMTYYLSQAKKTLAAYFSVWHISEREKMYRPGIWEQLSNHPAESARAGIIGEFATTDPIFRVQQMDMRTFMVDDVLTKVDRVSMQNSLEVRVPLLDHEFAELSFRIPSDLKLRGNEQKYILKKAVAGYLPDSVLNHKKQGFALPLKVWFKDDLKEYVNDRLVHTQGPLYDYLDPKFVAKIIGHHHNGMRDFSHRIWTLLFLDEWLKQQTQTYQLNAYAG
jgi:asparagine synthase (glutamine-hydrolysing)